ncbi:glycosyltransferase 87 family protein [Streptomyces sp. Rer75]|uniref:glycosyltransferase 87 family protein n=1 Tax=Streptomyces sp. Rer75 TaxID=2750011 RepID=UPI0015CFF5C4|nr:glycosyltransferase 87 family protein [Streptomyces sp. Rer75]QLH21637.1 DUF2029 domain-containing protein [Streptomyces sp. Rer75]
MTDQRVPRAPHLEMPSGVGTGRPGAGTRTGALGWAACALVALALAAVSDLAPHRVWGVTAAFGYAVAALVAGRRPAVRCLAGRHRAAATTAALGAAVLPLAVLVVADAAQPETAVVERSGALLLSTGSPYLPQSSAVADHNPYLPGMAVFGLPHALFGDGPLTDPRWWLAAAFAVSVVAAGRLGVPRRRVLPWLVACPLVALPLAVGGVDLPVAGLMCLGLVLADRGRAGRAGLALGAAAALKWTAWPALPVALALLAGQARRGDRIQPRPSPPSWARPGTEQPASGAARPASPVRWSAGPVRWPASPVRRCGVAALATLLITVVPVLLAGPRAFVRDTVVFPLGLADAPSPAASPFPGHLLAAYVPGGTLVAAALLAVAAASLAASLWMRPPPTLASAARRLALGLGLAIALMPATRFGYLVHPLVLLAALASRRAAR